MAESCPMSPGVPAAVGTSVRVESTCAPVAGSNDVTPVPLKSRSCGVGIALSVTSTVTFPAAP